VGKPTSAAVAVAVLLATSGIADAGARVLFAPVYGEADVADEAAAVHLLVRSAFSADDPTAIIDVVGRPPTLDGAASALNAVDAQHLVLIEVDRLGPSLAATVQIIDRTGAIAGKLATQAGDGGVTELATDLAREIGRVSGLAVTDPIDLSTGQLRPFARALQLVHDGKPEDAARALAGADPLIALRVSAAGAVATSLWKDDKLDPAARLIACIVACPPRDVMTLTATDRSAAARSARAHAQVGLSDAAAAALELSGMPESADTALARAAISHLRQDRKARDAAIADLVNAPGTDPTAVAWLAKLPPGILAPGLEAGVVRLGEQSGSGRLSAAIGLRAAEACDGPGTAPTPAGSAAGSGSAGAARTDEPTVCTGLGGLALDRALAMIAITELDRTERARLKPIVAKAAGTDAMRLIAEIAFAENDHATAQAALAKLKRSTDPRAAMYRGRIAWMLGDLALAAEELGDAGAAIEQARVLLAKGDAAAAAKVVGINDRSRVLKVANAAVALAESRPADAVKQLRLAEELAPGDRDTQVRLANALELAGDIQAARAVRARLVDLAEPKGLIKAPVAAGSGSGSGSGSATLVDESAKLSSARLAVRASIRDMLATFPPAALDGKSLVMAPIGEAPSEWALREVDPEPLVRELQIVIESVHHGRISARAVTRLPDRPSAGELSALASSHGGETVLAYAVNVDGDVRLVMYDGATQTAFEQHGTIDVDALDMVHWNLRWLIIPLGIGGVLLGLAMLAAIRGSGVIEVKVRLDPQGKNEVLCIELQKTKRRWMIRDLDAFRESTTAAGAKVGRRTARLVGDMTRFKVPPGHWYVHLYGVYDRPGGARTLDEEHTKQVTLQRSSRVTVEVDLVPHTAELRIKVRDENPRGAMVWIDDGPRSYTDGKGEVVMYAPMGEHVLHVEARGIKLDRQLLFTSAITDSIEFDFTGMVGTASRPGMSKPGFSRPGVSRSGMSSPGMSSPGMSMPGKGRPSSTAPGATRAAMSSPKISMPGGAAKIAASASPDTTAVGDPPDMGDQTEVGNTAPPGREGSMPKLDLPADQSLSLGKPQKPGHAGTMPSMVGRAVAAQAKAQPLAHGSLVPPAATAPRGGITPNAGAAATVAIPDLLCGRYRIKQTLGRGAMGVVYRARDEHLEREVAIKVLASELRHHPDALRFFTEEAKALAQLNHPNIVSVFDQTTVDDETYLVMEFVDGRTLDSLLEEKRKLPVHTSLALIDQLCSGLAYVHARRVIHRDIKPANIFVSRDRIVKLGDFGLARVMHELSIRRTEIRGTPLYMAPEQITGENVTHRSDLYAVGCTLFELVTGRTPFMEGEILYHHLHTAPPKPSSFEPSLTPAFDELVLDCIAKEADQRIESATAIRERIRALGIQSQSSPSIKVIGR
jgi:tetratricopeptide (TPR) repeat protein